MLRCVSKRYRSSAIRLPARSMPGQHRILSNVRQLLRLSVTTHPHLERLPCPARLLEHDLVSPCCWTLGRAQSGHDRLIGRSIHAAHGDHNRPGAGGRLAQRALELISTAWNVCVPMVKSKGTQARKPARETRVCATVLLAVARAIAKTRRTTAKFFMDCLPFRGMGPVAAAGTGARHTSGFTVEGSGERALLRRNKFVNKL